jgi:CRP/FNR family transcriptional regulator
MEQAPEISVAPRLFRANECVYQPGDECDGVYIVRSGVVRTIWTGADGSEQILGFHYPGALIGLEALSGNAHSTRAESVGTSTVCILPAEELADACAQSPTLVMRLLELASEVASADERRQVNLARSAEQRVAAFLLDAARQQEHIGCSRTEILLPMRRRDIASHLAMAGETISRIFAKFEATGMVEVDPGDRHRVTLESVDSLVEMAAEQNQGLRRIDPDQIAAIREGA